jgi:hypothetical protein
MKELYKDVPYKYQNGDKYNPALIGGASALVPGLGQIITKEYGRGALLFLGTTTGAFMFNIGFIYVIAGEPGIKTPFLFIGGLALFNTCYLLSITNAMKIARIKNLYYRDLKINEGSIQLNPYINASSFTGGMHKGITLRVCF